MGNRSIRAYQYVTIVLFMTFLFSSDTEACSFKTRLLSGPNVDEFVFIGTVIGYSGPIDHGERKMAGEERYYDENLWNNSFGIKVKVKESVLLRRTPHEYFEVYPYFYSFNCKPIGTEENWLRRTFTVGSDIFIVGELSTLIPFDAGNGNLRLGIQPRTGGIGSVSNFGEYQPTAASLFDYNFLASLSETADKHGLVNFELRKDLLRLEKEQDVNNKIEVLKRLSAFRSWQGKLDLFTIYRNSFSDKAKADSLYVEKLRSDGWKKDKIKSHLKCKQEKAAADWRTAHHFPC